MAVPSLFDLSGYVVLVTGGNSGIGKGLALGYAQHGARVVVAARDVARNAETKKEIEASGGQCVTVQCDMAQRCDIEAAVQACRDNFGRLDVLVANAGIGGPDRVGSGDLALMEDELFDKVMNINLRSVFQCCRAAFPLLKESGRGRIITIGSMYSLYGSAMSVGYSASKGAIVQLTKSLAVSWAKFNINTNCILPGWITSGLVNDQVKSAVGKAIEGKTPHSRFGEPAELVGAAVFLSGPASQFVTGISLPVDGGFSIAMLPKSGL